MVGHADSSVLGFVLAGEARQEECHHQTITPAVGTLLQEVEQSVETKEAVTQNGKRIKGLQLPLQESL